MGVYELSGAGSVKTGRTLYTSMNAGNQFGAMVPIANFTFTGTGGSVTFSNIDQSYQDLRLVVFVRSNFAGSQLNLIIRFNGDASSVYSYTRLTGNGSAASSTREVNFTGVYPGIIPASTSTAGVFGSAAIDILNYKNTSTFKTCISRVASDLNGSGTTDLGVQLWRNTAAINSLNISDVNGDSWVAGSTATLYGIRAVSS